MSRPAIIIQADRFEVLRCRCPVCLILDARFPGEGWQLALFPYRLQGRTAGDRLPAVWPMTAGAMERRDKKR